jgi:putative glutamine amidotransferase
MPASLIGLTGFRETNQYGHPQISVNEAYIKAITNAGASPLIIPLGLSETQLELILTRLDGIVFTGGGDIQPQCYGNQPHPLVSEVDTDRDRVEIHLVQRAIESRLPFLGICRGLQVVNVALGGTLYEDILDQRPAAIQHQYYPDWPRNYLAHTVRVEKDSRLQKILGMTEPMVNSLHHQGIDQLATSLQATAYAPDGLIEAFELTGDSFGLAVQWHPEWLQEYLPMQAIFQALVQATGRND